MVTPSFVGRRERLTRIEVGESRKVSNVRIHVERVIGDLRSTYTILKGPVSVCELRVGPDGLSFIDKVSFVCCCLLNVSSGVVSG